MDIFLKIVLAYVALDGSNSKSPCLGLLSPGIMGIHYDTWLYGLLVPVFQQRTLQLEFS